MYCFYPHIASLYSSVGFAWLLLALLVCAVVTRVSYPPFLNDCLTVVFSRISRRYSDNARPSSFVFSHLFLLGTLALSLWLCLSVTGPLQWLHYGLLVLLLVVWLLSRYVLSRFLGYVFSIRHETQAVQEDSVLLLMLASLLFYVLCCLIPWMPVQVDFRWVAVAVISLYLIVLTGKVMVTYARSFRMLFYIFLYILTLEIVPLAMLYRVASHITAVV
ncbi:MAG: DUF4271 domain-containing protein [Paludibacteraceae bacterium]|nr:DUF4271 domain-containing protein [Paludibacteraceae bacterium]